MSYPVMSKDKRYTSKTLYFLGSLAFFLLIVFNKSEYKIRFLDWGSGALVFGLFAIFVLFRGRIYRRDLFVFVLPQLWAVYALLGSHFALNRPHHLAALVQAILLSLLASVVVIAVFSFSRKRISKAVFVTACAWTFISLGLFVLWSLGWITYEKVNFSGLFRNRNEFAVQTVILMGLIIFFVQIKPITTKVLLFLNLLMTMATLSLKGFALSLFVLFYPWFLKERSSGKKTCVLLLGLFTLVLFSFSVPGLQDRIVSVWKVLTAPESLPVSSSPYERRWLIIEGSKIAFSKPLFGVGVDNARFVLFSPKLQRAGSETGLGSHNNYIEMMLNSGLVGLLLYYLPLLYISLKTKRKHPHWLEIKTLILLYLLAGIAMVQYNNFISIFLYCLVIFLYFDYKGVVHFDQNSIYR